MSIMSDELMRHYAEVSPLEFYREIFPDGELDTWAEGDDPKTPGKYVGIAVEITKEKKANGKPLVKRYSITDELDGVDYLTYSKNFCVMAPISYAGKSRESSNARIMYALCIELDNLIVTKDGRQRGLEQLIFQWSERADWIPQPTFLVASGSGVHLYYVFEEGIPLFKNVVESLKRYKYELTEKIWNRKTTSSIGDQIQHESVFQAFRMVGTPTKAGDKVRAYRTGDRVSIKYMNHFVGEKNQIATVYKSNLLLKEAQEKYPEWFERRVINKQPRGSWTCSRAVYEWWYSKILNGATVGHRYYCLMMLCIYAIKCDIPEDELEEDCLKLMEIFDQKSDKDENRFTEKDVYDALQAFYDKTLVTYPVNSIQNRSGIEIPKNKRNGRKRALHVKFMNLNKEFKVANGECTAGGRPRGSGTAQWAVQRWRGDNPTGTKAACIRVTGLSKPTVYKWWDEPIKEDPYALDLDNVFEIGRIKHDTLEEGLTKAKKDGKIQ